jgi:hypothetical protein
MTVETPDPTSSVLPRCASGPDNFYMLTSANQMIPAFNSIGTSLPKLRVSSNPGKSNQEKARPQWPGFLISKTAFV